MTPAAEVIVVRLSHRPGRDERMTTHVGLTARALGADRVLYPENATDAVQTLEEVTDRFGGPFAIETASNPLKRVERAQWDVVHLTMYGLPVQDTIASIREEQTDPLAVVVGGPKVPGQIFECADWNVAVTNQPHSEVAALAVFLDRFFDGCGLEKQWEDADRTVIPQPSGKRVVDAEK